ncbi:MAG: HAD family hydrolase [Mycobacteriales bacterium]
MAEAIEAVVFDWGGTLATHHDVDPAALWRTALAGLPAATREALLPALAAAERRFWEAHRDTVGAHSGVIDVLFAEACEVAAVTVTDVEAVFAALMATWEPYTRTEPDVAGTLAALRERGLRIGLLSNTFWRAAWHEGFLARDGVLDLIDVRVYTSDLPCTKPHADAFAAVLDTLGTPPERAVMVGDRLFDDILGAGRLGMRTVHRDHPSVPTFWPAADVTPDATITRIGELPAVLDRWL